MRDPTDLEAVTLREPADTRLALATEGPGMTVDEPLDSLGTSLVLPPALEARRDEVEKRLPPLDLSPAAPT